MGRAGPGDGAFDPVDVAAGRAQRPRLSPSGERVAFEVPEPSGTSVYVYDMTRRTTAKLTQSGADLGVAWRPDGRALVVFSRRPDARGLFLKVLDDRGGLQREDLLLAGEEGAVLRPESFTPDGGLLAYTRQRGSQHDIWLIAPGDPASARPLRDTSAREHSPKLAPNGRALAYVSDESGRSEVYVRPFPQGAPIRVSAAGGFAPVWSRDGRRLFYAASEAGAPVLMGVPVTWSDGVPTLGAPSVALQRRVRGPAGVIEQYVGGANWGPGFDVLPDGRFLVLRGPDPGGAREIVLVQQWFQELDGRAAGR
jgi:serine/threonine-protein kinase